MYCTCSYTLYDKYQQPILYILSVFWYTSFSTQVQHNQLEYRINSYVNVFWENTVLSSKVIKYLLSPLMPKTFLVFPYICILICTHPWLSYSFTTSQYHIIITLCWLEASLALLQVNLRKMFEEKYCKLSVWHSHWIDLLILTAGQSIWSYFMPRSLGITFKFIFWHRCLFFFSFLQMVFSNTNNLNRSIHPIEGTLTGTTNLSQCGPGRNGMEGVIHTP